MNEIVCYWSFICQVLEAEVTARQRTVQGVLDTGQELIATGHPSKRQIQTRMGTLKERLETLREYVELRKWRLQVAAESHQVGHDINDNDDDDDDDDDDDKDDDYYDDYGNT